MPSRQQKVLFLLTPTKGFFLMLSLGLGVVFLPLLAAMVGSMTQWDISRPGVSEQVDVLSAVTLLSMLFLWWRGSFSGWRTLLARGATSWWVSPIGAACLVGVVSLQWHLIPLMGSREVWLVGLALLPLFLLWGYAQDLRAHFAPFSGKRKWFDDGSQFAPVRELRDYRRFLPYPAMAMFLFAYVGAFAWGTVKLADAPPLFGREADVWMAKVVVSSMMVVFAGYILGRWRSRDPWELDWLNRGWASEGMPMWERRILWAATQEQDGVHSLVGRGRESLSTRILKTAVSKVFLEPDPAWAVGDERNGSTPGLRLPAQKIWRLLVYLYGPVSVSLVMLIVLPLLLYYGYGACYWSVKSLMVPAVFSMTAWAGFALSYHLYVWAFQLASFFNPVNDMRMITIDKATLLSIDALGVVLRSETVMVLFTLLTVAIPAYATWLSTILN